MCIRDSLCTVAIGIDQRRAPTAFADSATRLPPDFFTVAQLQCSQIWILRSIADDHDSIAVDYRGTCKAPADAVLTDVDGAQVFFPKQFTVNVVTVQAFRAEEREYMFSIDADAGVGVSRFGMAGGSWF